MSTASSRTDSLSEPVADISSLFEKIEDVLIDLKSTARDTIHRERYVHRVERFVSNAQGYVRRFRELLRKSETLQQNHERSLSSAFVSYLGILLYIMRFFVRYNSGMSDVPTSFYE
jgi:hypothetical protein